MFTLATIADPPAIVRLGLPVLPFVCLGAFRLLLRVLGVAEPDRPLAGAIARAAAWTMVVPAIAWMSYHLAIAIAGPLPEQVLWLAYEIAFVALALWWRAR